MSLRVDITKDVADGAILAAGIHPLQNDQDLLLMFGIQEFLQIGELSRQDHKLGLAVIFNMLSSERVGHSFSLIFEPV